MSTTDLNWPFALEPPSDPVDNTSYGFAFANGVEHVRYP